MRIGITCMIGNRVKLQSKKPICMRFFVTRSPIIVQEHLSERVIERLLREYLLEVWSNCDTGVGEWWVQERLLQKELQND